MMNTPPCVVTWLLRVSKFVKICQQGILVAVNPFALPVPFRVAAKMTTKVIVLSIPVAIELCDCTSLSVCSYLATYVMRGEVISL